jgi:hypothetical protein
MTHAVAMVGRRRNSGTGTASMARAPGSIASGAAGPTVAATASATTAMATTAAIAMRKGDLAGRQMTAEQCDGGSGQRRTNDRRYYEPRQSLLRAFHDQFSFQVHRLVAAPLATPSEPAIPLRVKTLQGSQYSIALVHPPASPLHPGQHIIRPTLVKMPSQGPAMGAVKLYEAKTNLPPLVERAA